MTRSCIKHKGNYFIPLISRPSNSHGLTVRLTVWDAISRSHSFASKSHGGPENLEIAKNSAKYEETLNNQFITVELIKLICVKTWVQCQFQ